MTNPGGSRRPEQSPVDAPDPAPKPAFSSGLFTRFYCPQHRITLLARSGSREGLEAREVGAAQVRDVADCVLAANLPLHLLAAMAAADPGDHSPGCEAIRRLADGAPHPEAMR